MNYNIIPDTHILIRALINPNSKEREAILIAQKLGSINLNKSIIDECYKILTRKDYDEDSYLAVIFLTKLKKLIII